MERGLCMTTLFTHAKNRVLAGGGPLAPVQVPVVSVCWVMHAGPSWSCSPWGAGLGEEEGAVLPMMNEERMGV